MNQKKKKEKNLRQIHQKEEGQEKGQLKIITQISHQHKFVKQKKAEILQFTQKLLHWNIYLRIQFFVHFTAINIDKKTLILRDAYSEVTLNNNFEEDEIIFFLLATVGKDLSTFKEAI